MDVSNQQLEFALSPQFRGVPKLDEYDLPQIIDSKEIVLVLQESWGNQILLDNKHIGWPAGLHVKNVSEGDGEICLEWQLCCWVGFVEPGRQVCSPAIISSGTQLASP
ncbi:MAG: hypothetical protein DWQ07_24895 [Chloroflexi bacterium]|nr:MAG: hypothetical protein DWQ07_24895 [Chloroflexota bacterium]MBL1197069.1 hypothetical protein [Chloroflexota bacterium]NOH14364.1 hypothetical protein [Chloroflexota bacterium]